MNNHELTTHLDHTFSRSYSKFICSHGSISILSSNSHTAAIVRNTRFRRDARALEEEEEMWFSQEDDSEDNDTAAQVSELLKNKVDSDADHIQKLWETKKGGF